VQTALVLSRELRRVVVVKGVCLMFRRLLVASVAFMAIGYSGGLVATVQAQDGDLVMMGSKNVSLGGEVHSIDVSAARGGFQAVRLYAKRRDIEIERVEVVYSDGKIHNEQRKINLLVGERTREINRTNDIRFIDKINIYHRPQAGAIVPSLIEVFGVQTSAGARATRPAGGPAPSASAATGVIAATPTPSVAVPVKPGTVVDAGEVLFGAQSVGFGVDRDVIRVGADIGKFDRVRIRVLDNDIFIRSMKVIYANNESEEVAYNANVNKDTRTRWIQLKGDRFIKEIQMVYNSRPNFKGQAYLEVYGQYAEGWLGPQGEGKKYNAGWVLLGAQTAGFTIDRNDTIKVGRNEGGFRKIRVQAVDQAITLFDVRVIYGNGEVDVIPANRTRVDAGSTFGPIDLKGGARVIQEIRPTYRTRVFQQGGVAKGRAIVQFWGQH
jgi:hypothetical protein